MTGSRPGFNPPAWFKFLTNTFIIMTHTFHFLCGEEAVKVYHDCFSHLRVLSEMTNGEHGDLVDNGHLAVIEVTDDTTFMEVIEEVIEIHGGNFEILLIPENDYNLLKEKGMKA